MRCLLFLLLIAPLALAQSPGTSVKPVKPEDTWPGFRGPTGDGVSVAKGVPTTFGEKENVRWKTAIHDKGWSSPVVWGDQVWLTTAKETGEEMYAVCVNRKTGKVEHDLKLFTVKSPPKIAQFNSFASPTPFLADGFGYFHFGSHGTACIELATGKLLWSDQGIHCDHWRGPASSPVVWEDRVFLTFDGHDKQFFACLDKKTGQHLWMKDRAIKWKTNDGDLKKAFSTPQVIEVDGKPQVISSAAEATIAYDPKTGDELWTVYHGGMNEACRPVYAHGLVYLTAGHVKNLLAVKPGSGDLTDKSVAWKLKDGPTRPSPVVLKDHIYVVNDDGTAFCLDAKTGKEVWKERLADKCSASPVLIEGNLFCCTESGKDGGKVDVIAASPTFNRVATNKLDAGCKASPAAVGDALFIRTHTHLYCISK